MCQPLLLPLSKVSSQKSFSLPTFFPNPVTVVVRISKWIEVGTPTKLLPEATVSVDFMDGVALGAEYLGNKKGSSSAPKVFITQAV